MSGIAEIYILFVFSSKRTGLRRPPNAPMDHAHRGTEKEKKSDSVIYSRGFHTI